MPRIYFPKERTEYHSQKFILFTTRLKARIRAFDFIRRHLSRAFESRSKSDVLSACNFYPRTYMMPFKNSSSPIKISIFVPSSSFFLLANEKIQMNSLLKLIFVLPTFNVNCKFLPQIPLLHINVTLRTPSNQSYARGRDIFIHEYAS